MLLKGSEDREITLECLDDIEFEDSGSSLELLQLKHHTSPCNITDSCPELWKTIRIWSEHIQDGRIDPLITSFTLVTTATSPESSIASKLRPDDNRQTELALEELIHVAENSDNSSLIKAFEAFLSLDQTRRQIMVNSIFVLDNSPNIKDTADLIKGITKIAVARKYRESLFERIEGWWFGKVISQLSEEDPKTISGFELIDKITSISEQFQPETLPIDYLDAIPDNIDPENDKRQFVLQVKLITLHNRTIEKAIIDYYRAFEQRSRWVRESLLIDNELERYEARLVDEWERYKDAITGDRNIDQLSEDELVDIGKNLYNWMQFTVDRKIRQNVTELYVTRGSFHILADNSPPKVGWHPKFIDRLSSLLQEIN